MIRIAVTKIGNEITGVFCSSENELDGVQTIVQIIDFEKTLAPWEESTLELIEQNKLLQIA